MKKVVKQLLKERVEKQDLVAHISGLAHQGGLLSMLAKEHIHPEWQSCLNSLKTGTVKFILNYTINTLPTMDNLKTWKNPDKCRLC